MEDSGLKIRIPDIILTAAIVVVCVVLTVIIVVARSEGSVVRIYKDGILFDERNIYENAVINVDGLMDVVIENGKVRVENSVCPSGSCEHSAAVSKKGESIICLPNKILIQISGEGETDAISG